MYWNKVSRLITILHVWLWMSHETSSELILSPVKWGLEFTNSNSKREASSSYRSNHSTEPSPTERKPWSWIRESERQVSRGRP